MNVPIPAHLSYTGKLRWENKAIDSCIAPIVKALNDAGIYTSGCCCGHGKSDGNIILHDGRELIIRTHLTKRATDAASPAFKNGKGSKKPRR